MGCPGDSAFEERAREGVDPDRNGVAGLDLGGVHFRHPEGERQEIGPDHGKERLALVAGDGQVAGVDVAPGNDSIEGATILV